MADENVVEENTRPIYWENEFEERDIPEEMTSLVEIDPVILTPEVVDNFRLNYDDPSEALARDLVASMQMDYPDQMAQDPNFLTYEGLIGGTAPFLDFLPSTKGKTPTKRTFTADQAVVLFSNAQPASFARPLFSEFFKSVPATEAIAATARVTGPRIIPATTAAGATFGPAGAGAGFAVGVIGTGALSLLAGGAAYLLGDHLEEQVMGPDPVITPGQRAEYEAYRTLGGGFGAIRFPWLMSPTSNIAGNAMLSNIANDAGWAQSLKLVSGLDNIISSTGKAASRNVKLTAAGEVVASTGSAVGAYQAERMEPGATGTRLAAELIGGNVLYATLLKTLPRILGSETVDEVGGMAVTRQQQKLFENINKLYADYGSPEQYDDLVKNLTDPEMTKMLQEAFPGVDFTAAQRGGDPLLMGIEAVKAGGEPGLEMARKKADREALGFMTKFIQGLIDDGSPENVRKAAALRISIFDDMLRNGLDIKMTKFLEANERLAAQPGQTAARSKQELSEELYDMVGNYITAAGNKERELWGAVPNIEVISPMGPDTEFADLPAFMRVFEEISYVDPAVQQRFRAASPLLFNFMENARRDLGLDPAPVLSDPEIVSLEKYKNIFDNAVAKLAGFDAENEIVTIMETANALPLGERATFLRSTQQDIKQNLKNLEEPEDQKRLGVALDKAADYAGVQATTENRAVQRSGEASSDDVAPITADRLAEVRSALLREARSLASDTATSDEARRIGLVAEAISEDLDLEGFGEAMDVARAYTRAKHDFLSRTVVGQIGQTQRSGAARLPAEVTFETFIKSNPSITLSRVRQLQGLAEFADRQGLPTYLPEEVIAGSDTVFTTTTNLIDSYLRGLKQVASKEVFDSKTNKNRTVINATALEEWKAQNNDVLEAFPQLKIDLENASSAQRAVEVMEQNFKKGTELARSQTALANLIDGMSPTQAVADAFNSNTPVKSFRNLFSLRRMGADNIRSRQAARTGQLRALRSARSAEIQEAGLDTTEVNAAMGRAVLEHAYLAAGGEGAFNPQVFYKTLFGKMPKADQSLMDIADQFKIFPEKTKTRLKFMSQQMMRVQAADAAGKLTDPDFVASAGPILDFYVGVLGSAAGSAAFKQVGGSGPGVISASSTGTRELRKFMLELPQTAKLRAIDMMFTDAALIAKLMQRPGTESGQKRLSARIVSYLNDKLFNTSTSMSPFIVREGFEEEDRGLDSPLAEDPNVEIPALQQQPPAPATAPQQPPAPATPQQPPAPPVASSGPVDREKFAALFPEDRELMGIGSLMAPVQYMGMGGRIGSPYAESLIQPMGQIASPMGKIGKFASSTLAQGLPQPMGQIGSDEDHSMERGFLVSPPERGQMGSERHMSIQVQQGIGGAFQQNRGGQPLNVYKDYLNQTYLGREQEALSRQVDEFVDLVDQAERAHFNAEESFGYGGGPSYQNLTSPVQPDISRFVSQRIR